MPTAPFLCQVQPRAWRLAHCSRFNYPRGVQPPRNRPVLAKAVLNQDPHTLTHPTSALQSSSPRRLTNPFYQGRLFDVSNNKAYQPGGGYAVFAGHDASRALAKSSLKPEECVPEWEDLDAAEKKTLEEWYVFFSKRYNIVGLVEGATNMG